MTKYFLRYCTVSNVSFSIKQQENNHTLGDGAQYLTAPLPLPRLWHKLPKQGICYTLQVANFQGHDAPGKQYQVNQYH